MIVDGLEMCCRIVEGQKGEVVVVQNNNVCGTRVQQVSLMSRHPCPNGNYQSQRTIVDNFKQEIKALAVD